MPEFGRITVGYPRQIHGRVCSICEEVVPENAEIVSREFYLCPKCTSFFREYMLARMEESSATSNGRESH